MRFHNVCLESIAYTLPPQVVTSDEIETRLAPVYQRLNLPAGRLELMTGIRERRFFDPGTKPGNVSALTAKKAVEQAGIEKRHFGALIHGSVCRDQLEPATASGVHHALGLPSSFLVFDISNACLGLLNGMLILAEMIESKKIEAGIVVGTETGRELVEGTIDSLLKNPDVTRKSIKYDIASLTIGSASAAVVLCDAELSKSHTRFLGGAYRTDTDSHELCAGGSDANRNQDGRPRMTTDSEALLHAGIDLAGETWQDFRRHLQWNNDDVDKVFTHQVGKAHSKLLFERLELSPDLDFPTVEFLGNTGAAALPVSLALGAEQGHLKKGDKVAMLGIGSGLNCIMLGLEW